MSTFILTAMPISPNCCKLVQHPGITVRSRPCALKRSPLKVPNASFGSKVGEYLGFITRAGTVCGKELRVCWCQKDSTDIVSEENDFSEGDSLQHVESEVGSSSQVEGFSRLPSSVPWGAGEVATTMIIFWALFHIPLGLGGLDIVAKVLPEQFLDPQTQAVSLVFVQLLELTGTIWLMKSTIQPFGPVPISLSFRFNEVWRDKGWLPASAAGLLVLLVAVAAMASLTQDVSTTEVSNGSSALTSLMRSTPLARVAIYMAYCGLTPFLEEYVYRGFLLSSLATYMRWPLAVLLSAIVFSLSHLSSQGFLPLFFVGCCLGTAYTWNGNLATSFVIHSLYNAVVLTKALLYWTLPGLRMFVFLSPGKFCHELEKLLHCSSEYDLSLLSKLMK